MAATRLPGFAAAALLALLVTRPAAADQTDKRLDPLFTQLKTADDADAAQPVVAEIWRIWGESGNAQTDDLMAAGAAALAVQDGEQALAAFNRVTELAPKFAEGWNKRATTLYLLGRYADSVADIDKVLALEPRHFGALSGLGLCEVRRDRLPEAVAAFQRALAVNPNMPGVQFNLRAIQQEIAKRSI
jgi:tetratricopeptide (TPR) repeat protein